MTLVETLLAKKKKRKKKKSRILNYILIVKQIEFGILYPFKMSWKGGRKIGLVKQYCIFV